LLICKCWWNNSQNNHNHTFYVKCLNNSGYQDNHSHSHNLDVSGTWDNRPSYLTTFYIIRVK
jgi:hypothetical protein